MSLFVLRTILLPILQLTAIGATGSHVSMDEDLDSSIAGGMFWEHAQSRR